MIIEKEKCCGCGACVNSCPMQCISMKEDKEGFLYPDIHKEMCISCGLCQQVCPVKNERKPIGNREIERSIFAAFSKNEETRLSSSSGGIFSVFAELILEGNGVVYGASFYEKGRKVHHAKINSREDLGKLKGSKYLQSEINQIYQDVKNELEKGRVVLFTGTPCQIGGLQSYLQKDYENLYCMDMACHGVPSAKVWESYLLYLENKVNSKVQRISFRNKKTGWKKYSLSLTFDNGKIYSRRFYKDDYMRLFLSDICLRPSCYQCSFKGMERISDITVADLWGSESLCPELDDDRGISLVVVHSSKGRKLMHEAEPYIIKQEINLKEAVKYNPSMVTSVRKPKLRDEFMGDEKLYCNPRRWKSYLWKIRVRDLVKRFFHFVG